MSRLLPSKATPFFLGAPDLEPHHDQPSGSAPGGGQPNCPKNTCLPSVPVNFSGTVQSRTSADKNRAVFEEAIFILSQSQTGRDLLQQVTAAGYRIAFDDTRTGDRGAGGLCDPTTKMIILHAHESPSYMALLIAHECVHAVQNTKQDLFPSSEHRPEEGIRLSFAIEADAYAQQVQVALELFHGNPARPATQRRFEEPLIEMRRRFPDLTLAGERALIGDQALMNGAAVAASFEAFYSNFHLRTFYEDSHMDWAEECVPKKGGGLKKQFNKAAKADWIADRIQHRGQPYLKQHMPNLKLDDARHAGVSEKTARRITRFYAERLKRPMTAPVKVFGIHMKDAAAWIYGLNGRVQAVFKKSVRKSGKNPPKPPAANNSL